MSAIRLREPFLTYGDEAACRDTGTPLAHSGAIGWAAARNDVIIISRACGPTCTQLLELGYDTKGFRIHAKSCDWGPMAGFVLRDPRLNKAGMEKEKDNAREHVDALTDPKKVGWVAAVTPLFLLPERVAWLKRKNHITPQTETADQITGVAAHRTGIKFHYALFREERTFDMGGGKRERHTLWGVYFDRQKNALESVPAKFEQVIDPPLKKRMARVTAEGALERYEPMLAMTNPVAHSSYVVDPNNHANQYFRNAVTGDYDLFAIWPKAAAYDREGLDRRAAGTLRSVSEKKGIYAFEDRTRAKIGNITDRVHEICQVINSRVGPLRTYRDAGAVDWSFPGRSVCWHSDEAGRPGVLEVDLPLIAWVPVPNMKPVEKLFDAELRWETVVIRSIADFAAFIRLAVGLGFKCTLSEAWVDLPNVQRPAKKGGYKLLRPGDLPKSSAVIVADEWKDGPLKIDAFYNA
jgi:hypothetical protein